MLTPFELFQGGRLSEAVSAAVTAVREEPDSKDARWALITYLCFTGDLERAESHVRYLLENAPDMASEVLMQRSLMSAEAARRQCFDSGRLPEFVSGPTQQQQEILRALAVVREKPGEGVNAILSSVREACDSLSGRVDGVPFSGFRDGDDFIASQLEVISIGGQYFWLPWSSIRRIQFSDVDTPQDVIWRKAELTTMENHQITAFIPGLYCGTHQLRDDDLRCGRAAEFVEVAGVQRGTGGRVFVTGTEYTAMTTISEIVFE